MSLPPVSIIVLSYNTRDLTLTCLEQFTPEALSAGWQVIVVDNGSQDDTASAVRRMFPQVEVVCSQENRGFAAGNNLGLRRAEGKAVILMNSDVLASFAALAALPRFLDQHPRVGALSPQLRTRSGAPQAFAYGCDPKPGYLLRRGLHRLLGRGALLSMPQGAQFIARNIFVVVIAAFVAAGQQPVDHGVTGVCPASQRSAAEKLRVVGMG